MPFYNIKRKLSLPKEESEEFTFREIEDGIYFQGHNSVSYTHLDVYKRQGNYNALLLTTRKLMWHFLKFGTKPNFFQYIQYPAIDHFLICPACCFQCKFEVFLDASIG